MMIDSVDRAQYINVTDVTTWVTWQPRLIRRQERTHQTCRTTGQCPTLHSFHCQGCRKNPTQAKYHRRAEESLANNMGWSATELHQQGHTELYQKPSSLCESWRRTLWTSLNVKFRCVCLISMQALWWKFLNWRKWEKRDRNMFN